MKRILAVLLAGLLAISLCACAQTAAPSAPAPEPSQQETPEPSQPEVPETPEVEDPVIRLSTTTSVNDSGLLPYLQPSFEEDTGYRLEITSAGTGAAIEKGRTGDADALLVHAKASEEEFISEGYAKERIPFMYNFFVLVGPSDDPAGVKNCTDASAAFQAIADAGQTFISRGDESGTHKAELKIWDKAGIEPTGQSWYVSAGQGMGACLSMAAEQQAYVLTDKATYLAHEKRGELSLLLEKSDEMKNTYSMLAILPEKWPDTNYDGACAFIEWMTSEKALKLIAEYGMAEYGEQLFFVE